MGSSIRAVAQCRPDQPAYLPPSTMVVLDNKHNPELEEEEEEETSVVDSLTEEEMMTERSELGRLHQLLPTLCIKENVSQLDITLEAIRYIDSLTHKLGICSPDTSMDHQDQEC